MTEGNPFTEGLDADQLLCWKNVVLGGRNMFITGGAGVGKSRLVKSISEALRIKHAYRRRHNGRWTTEADLELGRRCTAVTATTGTAAALIDAVTVHSWAGVGYARGDAVRLLTHMTRAHRTAWRQTRSLIIDEVSMLDRDVFEKLDQLGRFLRGNPGAPFGGIQLIAVGDFFQLPPVVPKWQNEQSTRSGGNKRGGGGGGGGHGASRHTATDGIGRIVLTDEHSLDGIESMAPHFVPIPGGVGVGGPVTPGVAEGWARLTPVEESAAFLTMCRRLAFEHNLYEQHDAHASRSVPFCFTSRSWTQAFAAPRGCVTILSRVYRQNDPVFVGILNRIRVGDIQEADMALLRSRIGVTLRAQIETPDLRPTELYSKNIDVASINNAALEALPGPLRAYDMECNVTSGDAFKIPLIKQHILKSGLAPGCLSLKVGAQVMLTAKPPGSGAAGGPADLCNGSRGIVIGFDDDVVVIGHASERLETTALDDEETAAAEAAARELMRSAPAHQRREALPVVRFANGLVRTIARRRVKVSDDTGLWRGSFTQLPLILASALTIHRSQGDSLDCVRVDLGEGLFEAHQGYVALSRVRSLEGLSVVRLEPRHFTISNAVKMYYASLNERVANEKQAANARPVTQ